MKIMLSLGVVALIGIGAFYFVPTKATEYKAPSVIEKEVTVEVNPLDEQIKQREKELEDLYGKARHLEASNDIIDAEIKRLQEQKLANQKELAGFTQAIASKK